MIPETIDLLDRLEANPGAPIVGRDAALFHRLNSAMANSAAVQAEFNPPFEDHVEMIRTVVYERCPAGSVDRVLIDAAVASVLSSANVAERLERYQQMLLTWVRILGSQPSV